MNRGPVHNGSDGSGRPACTRCSSCRSRRSCRLSSASDSALMFALAMVAYFALLSCLKNVMGLSHRLGFQFPASASSVQISIQKVVDFASLPSLKSTHPAIALLLRHL